MTVGTYPIGTPMVGSSRDGKLREHASWSPYDDNGGTVLGVAGESYAIIAASTRMSTGFSILTRDSSKFVQIAPGVVIGTAGMQADARTLHKTLQARAVQYQFAHQRPINVGAAAQLLSNTLYHKRFFPYYTANLCVGLDAQGRGAIYTYDGIGSHERTGYSCEGTGKDLIQPVLDNQLKTISPLVLPEGDWIPKLPLETALDLVKDAFVAAGERDIYTGDAVEILIITKDGVRREELPLKKD